MTPEEPRFYAPLFCPLCRQQHVDRGAWATVEHHTHLCEHCGYKWRVEPYTFGAAPRQTPAPSQPKPRECIHMLPADSCPDCSPSLADRVQWLEERASALEAWANRQGRPTDGAMTVPRQPPPPEPVCALCGYTRKGHDEGRYGCCGKFTQPPDGVRAAEARCETCNRTYDEGNIYCSDGFHCCRACTWVNGKRAGLCKEHWFIVESTPAPQPQGGDYAEGWTDGQSAARGRAVAVAQAAAEARHVRLFEAARAPGLRLALYRLVIGDGECNGVECNGCGKRARNWLEVEHAKDCAVAALHTAVEGEGAR